MTTTIRESGPLRLTRDEVMARLADRGFVVWRGTANATLPSDLVDHQLTTDEITIHTTAAIGADWLPRKVAAAASTLPTITRVETWDRRSGAGRTEFSGFGVPASASATMRIESASGGSGELGGCVLHHEVRLRVDLPLVGGLIEKALAGRIAETLRQESALYDSYRSGTDRSGAPTA